jgi:ParB family chromosome partitioning protein
MGGRRFTLMTASNIEQDELIGGLSKLAEFERVAWQFKTIPIELLKPGRYQPRKSFKNDDLNELAASILTTGGNLSPVNVRPSGDGYEILAGERRWRAAQKAGLDELNCLSAALSESQAMIIAMVENVQRKDLNAIEEAEGYQRLYVEGQMNHADIAAATGKSRSVITNAIRLLSLDIKVRDYIQLGKLSAAAGRTIAGLEDISKQRELAISAVKLSWNVRQLEAAVAKVKTGKFKPETSLKSRDVIRLEETISENAGYPCQVKQHTSGRVELTFNFADNAGLEAFLQQQKFMSELN